MEYPGRMYQDNSFVFTGLNGLKIQELVVCEKSDTKEAVIVFVRIENNWHQYFLDAGLGFWENWNEIDFEDDDDYNYNYKTQDYEISEKVISKIWCEPEKNNCQIIIEFEKGERLILRTINPTIFDSECEIIFIK